ncbi:aspartate/glutamate racemase family protein [Acuticoccus sp. MNP-M23]|uniref:maleate cis-trans isomerase family protein n=1 Tax=Acuticoccus sp. MNP-M23 TaxID=3072793 RepID=UPI002815DC6E|nr:aspartate/glutamate racemase family protein [Acuticoccus sp. MNP-M23]WMS42222.1 aspartate/glutamate racemase family protein [Acuticoccus sp. MNP-M23]
MPATTRLGMLTPSSNTVLEPMTQAMIAGLDGVSAHFARFRVVEISLRTEALGQFQLEPMLAAAELLADAKVDAIAWNGTSAGWLGFDKDETLCAAIETRTGVPASSSVLALLDIVKRSGASTYGLVTPYVADVQDKIVETFAGAGLTCAAEEHLSITENFAFGEVSEARVREMCFGVARAQPDCIIVLCTNMRGGRIAADIEAETGIPVHDTVATAVWGALRKAGRDPSAIHGWGRLFQV